MQWYQTDPGIFDRESREGRLARLLRDLTRCYIAPMLMYPFEVVAWNTRYLMRDSRNGKCYIDGRRVMRNAKMMHKTEEGWIVSNESKMQLHGLWGKYYSDSINRPLLGTDFTCGARRDGHLIYVLRPLQPTNLRSGKWISFLSEISAPEEFTHVVHIIDLGNSGVRVFLWDGHRRLFATHIPNFDVPIERREPWSEIIGTFDLPWVPVSFAEESLDDIDSCVIAAPWGQVESIALEFDW